MVAIVLWVGVTPGVPSGKLPSAVSAEMQAAIVAVNKALGLESWPLHGAKPCVDRGGEGISSKDVSAEDTRRCAGAALAGGFPELGKRYALAILMAPVGPATVMAVWAGVFTALGMVFHNDVDVGLRMVDRLGGWGLLVVAAIVAGLMLRRWHTARAASAPSGAA